MTGKKIFSFKASLNIIGINPFVFIPEKILQSVFEQAGKDKQPIPVKGTVNRLPYKQTLMKYAGHWRLYINLEMLPHATKRIGETIAVSIEYDSEERTIPFHPKLETALTKNKEARQAFNSLSPSLQKEIKRYIHYLKTEESIERNVELAIGFLLGENRFAGRAPMKGK